MQKHNEWLKKAKSDLKAANLLLIGEVFDATVYHTQQSAEKALKAFLVYKKQSIKKTHDLLFLLEECKEFDKRFEIFDQDVADLNPFSTAFRYPDDYEMDPNKELASSSVDKSQRIYKFVLDIISEELTGQLNIFK